MKDVLASLSTIYEIIDFVLWFSAGLHLKFGRAVRFPWLMPLNVVWISSDAATWKLSNNNPRWSNILCSFLILPLAAVVVTVMYELCSKNGHSKSLVCSKNCLSKFLNSFSIENYIMIHSIVQLHQVHKISMVYLYMCHKGNNESLYLTKNSK